MSGGAGTESRPVPVRRAADLAADPGPGFRPAGDWPVSSRLDLRALPTAVPCARLHVRSRLHEWGLRPLAESAEVVTSELVTNAVSAAAGLPEPLVRLRIAADPRHVLVEVWDASPQRPVRRPPEPAKLTEEGGRGLLLVAVLSSDWGSYPSPPGKVVWATVPVPSG
jgi:anti-sigma regulatory factor (Ser/Thr protein kinase)